MSDAVTIWWVRQDFRLKDNAALAWAAARGRVLAVYIHDDNQAKPVSGAGLWWLQKTMETMGKRIPLVVRKGQPERVLGDLIREVGGKCVVWNRCYEPWAVARDKDLKVLLKDAMGVEVHSFNSALLHEPWEVKNLSGGDFKVFTPYWKACLKLAAEKAPEVVEVPEVTWVEGVTSDDWQFYPVKGEPDWGKDWDSLWTPGEVGAKAVLADFLANKMSNYPSGRDLPAQDWTSKLSPHLHFGEIGPRQVWHAAQAYDKGRDKFLSEIGWREFSHHLIWHYPTMVDSNWKPAFDNYPWRKLEGDALRDFEAWKRGQTGYPIVDAGMRQLWQTGWMHNRVRMITPSFLIKHLRIDWREGEKWFWDTLVDADVPNNVAGWQWVAGSGADASPYFRIFNPMLQGAKFDPDGAYVKRWCPELALLDSQYIHAPWEAPQMVLLGAKIKLGESYPRPIVDHETARAAALAGYELVKGEQG